MGDFLTRQNVKVETDLDRTVLTVSRTSFPMPYATAFKVASGIKMACTHAMRVCKEDLASRENYMNYDREIQVNEVSAVRRNTMVPTVEWTVQLQGENVLVWFGNVKISLHFSDALKVSAWIRSGAAQAKKWAGDTGKKMHCNGYLTDAENDYKMGYQ